MIAVRKIAKSLRNFKKRIPKDWILVDGWWNTTRKKNDFKRHKRDGSVWSTPDARHSPLQTESDGRWSSGGIGTEKKRRLKKKRLEQRWNGGGNVKTRQWLMCWAGAATHKQLENSKEFLEHQSQDLLASYLHVCKTSSSTLVLQEKHVWLFG